MTVCWKQAQTSETVLIDDSVKTELVENGHSETPRKRKLADDESDAMAFLDVEIIKAIHLLLPRLNDSIGDLGQAQRDTLTTHFTTLKAITDKLSVLRDKIKSLKSSSPTKVMKMMKTSTLMRKPGQQQQQQTQLVRKVIPMNGVNAASGQLQQERRLVLLIFIYLYLLIQLGFCFDYFLIGDSTSAEIDGTKNCHTGRCERKRHCEYCDLTCWTWPRHLPPDMILHSLSL